MHQEPLCGLIFSLLSVPAPWSARESFHRDHDPSSFPCSTDLSAWQGLTKGTCDFWELSKAPRGWSYVLVVSAWRYTSPVVAKLWTSLVYLFSNAAVQFEGIGGTLGNTQLRKTFSAFQGHENLSRVSNTRTRGWQDLCPIFRSQIGYTCDVFLLALAQVHHCISARQRGYFQTVDAKRAETTASIRLPNCHSQEVWRQFLFR